MKERSRVVKDGELVTKGKVIYFFCLLVFVVLLLVLMKERKETWAMKEEAKGI